MISVKILRGKGNGESHFDHFTIDLPDNVTVLYLLEHLNQQEQLCTVDGMAVEPIQWEANCQQKMCGSCAMVINHLPRLACHTFICDLSMPIIIEPLSKFPRIEDLVVDKTQMTQALMNMNLWLEKTKTLTNDANEQLYFSASCIMCGCCLEACPNYSGLDDFYGPQAMNASFRTISQETDAAVRKSLMKKANIHFKNTCSNSLACQRVCPMDIPLKQHISRLNHFWWKTHFTD